MLQFWIALVSDCIGSQVGEQLVEELVKQLMQELEQWVANILGKDKQLMRVAKVRALVVLKGGFVEGLHFAA